MPKHTCERVQQLARDLGYIPDPMLSALAVYRNSRKSHGFQGTLAWLTNYSSSEEWRDDEPYKLFWSKNQPYRLYYEGAQSRAKEHGYNLEIFELQEKGMTPQRLSSIFRARNIRGILVCPPPGTKAELEFEWEDFAAVTFGYSLTKPQLHRVATAQYMAMGDIMRHLRGKGYQRIACVVASVQDTRANHYYLSSYLAEQHLAGAEPLIPPMSNVEDSPRKFQAWLRQHRPDAVVTGNSLFPEFLRKLKIAAPKDIGVACVVLTSRDSRVSGIYEDHFHIGEVAVDYTVSMIQRGEYGVPLFPQNVSASGLWVEGETLRPQ